MRILFSGDLAPSGFGTVTMDLGRELLNLGEDVRFLSQNEFAELPEPFDSRAVNIRTFVIGPDRATGQPGITGVNDALRSLLTGGAPVRMYDGSAYGDWRPDAVVLLGDYDSVGMTVQAASDAFRQVPTFHYVPIEGVGLAPLLAETWDIARPVAMSQFGADQIEKVTGTRPPVVYHGVNADVFRPVDRQHPVFLRGPQGTDLLTTRLECKIAWRNFIAQETGITNIPKKWMLRTDRHMPRKRYASLLRSLVPVLAKHPEWGLVIHCEPIDQGGSLYRQLSKLHPTIRRQVLLTNAAGIPRDLLRCLYCAADMYVSNSAEGFGLTIAEAIACGIPAVGVGYSAVPEVIGPAGRVVTEGGLIDDQYDAFWWAADEKAFGAAVEDLMMHDTRREQLGRLGPEHIRSTFRWDTAAVQIRDLISASLPVEVAA